MIFEEGVSECFTEGGWRVNEDFSRVTIIWWEGRGVLPDALSGESVSEILFTPLSCMHSNGTALVKDQILATWFCLLP